MKKYDFVIIGFGKAGKTFAKQASKLGKKVALIEERKEMYGGTCINVACIPTKVLVKAAREGLDFNSAIDRKEEVVKALNSKNYHNLADDPNIDIFDGTGSFKSNKVVEVKSDGMLVDTLEAERIIINTGAKSFLPDIKGLKKSKFTHNSTSIMKLDRLPERLIILGAGYISLEFASFFKKFGSKVTILNKTNKWMPKEDREISQQIKTDILNSGIKIVDNVVTEEIKDLDKEVSVITSQGEFRADAVLIATGRVPNTDLLNLGNTDIQLGARGEILVDANLETSVKGIYAVGDVKGGMQFTYISLDDFRIISNQIFGNKTRTTNNRGNVPYSVFITPVLSRIGLTFDEAKEQGFDAEENRVFVNQIPRHKINNDARGLFKVVVNRENNLILGASLYGENAEELINYIKMAMDNNIAYTYLKDNIYTHPTMIESFNDLFDL